MPGTDPTHALLKAIRDEWSVMIALVRWRMRVQRHDAEDWLQDAIVRVLRAPVAQVRNWRAYLVTAAVHEGYRASKLRRERREVAFEDAVRSGPKPVAALNRVKLRPAA